MARQISEAQRKALDAGRQKFNSERGRAAQAKSVEARIDNKYLRDLLRKKFHEEGRDEKAFEELIKKAVGGDLASLEAIRKWLAEDEETATGTTIKVVVTDAEKVAIGKWNE